MDDKNALLDQLRIDRTTDLPDDDVGNRRWILIGVSIVLVAALAAGGWYFTRPSGVAVQAAVAREVTSSSAGGGSGGASMLDASGYVVARRQATVASKQIGRVVEVAIEEGQRVEKDQIIARLDDSNWRAQYEQALAQLAQAEANLRAAQVAFEDAKPIFKRNEQQMAAGVISAQTFDNARAAYNAAEQDLAVRKRGVELARAGVDVAKRNLDDTVVRAPFAGVVTVKAAQAGEIVSPSSAGGGFTRTGIGTIVDMDSLEVEVDVSENFINRVRPNQPATVKLNAYPDWEIPAHVIAVIPTADRSKATVKVRVGFKERDPRILPDMGARVSFLSEPEKQDGKAAPVAVSAVLIPPDAVQANGETGTVYIINSNDTVERRVVRLGARTSDGQLVLSGLTGGTRVAASNLAALSDGAKIHVVTAEAGQGEGS
ncbi:MAG TPA: efflux RND transporter periplasmic adaptor subunit [Steroidobacteraceae bacterium]|jgi:RND family efflux transporter MFP subunit|nr:efflux RND transporter periplasmic adaptor subunit [Steroidobacteraceae bacterium]